MVSQVEEHTECVLSTIGGNNTPRSGGGNTNTKSRAAVCPGLCGPPHTRTVLDLVSPHRIVRAVILARVWLWVPARGVNF